MLKITEEKFPPLFPDLRPDQVPDHCFHLRQRPHGHRLPPGGPGAVHQQVKAIDI
jgi:hypothetical protein